MAVFRLITPWPKRNAHSMKLQDLTWPEVDALSREVVVVIPTGSLEQHGAGLPLFTDSIIVTAVAEAVEKNLPEQVLLTPTLWLGASGHHLAFAGSLSNDFDSYMGAIAGIVESLIPHGFHRFFVLNGHGGNNDPNGMVTRTLKARYPKATFAQVGYFAYCDQVIAEMMEGPLKAMAHACAAETSLILHLRPELVRKDRLRDDGLTADPPIKGLVHFFDERTEQGSYGYATLGTAAKGEAIFNAAVEGTTADIAALANGYVLKGLSPG
jgi:creatinine amidohydrolase